MSVACGVMLREHEVVTKFNTQVFQFLRVPTLEYVLESCALFASLGVAKVVRRECVVKTVRVVGAVVFVREI
eukprot:2784977-Pleurochrysis_carterae.AAC.2